MSSNAKTRAARTKQGKCTVCLQRAATRGHPTCRPCREGIAAYSAERYAERRANNECARCGKPTDGSWLCEEHLEARRAYRAAQSRRR